MAKSRELVLFYDPEGGERANTFKTVLVCMGVRIKSVSGNDFAQTVGHLLGRAQIDFGATDGAHLRMTRPQSRCS